MTDPSSQQSTVKVWFESSSTLDKAEYDPVLGTLTVWFQGSGTRYQYLTVPRDVFDALVKADSPGSVFHALIRGKFEVMKLGRTFQGRVSGER